MATFRINVILESDIRDAGYTPAANGAFTSVGSEFTYDSTLMPTYEMVIEDNGSDQTTLSPDTDRTSTDGGPNPDNEGADGETGTLYDMSGNVIGTPDGRVASDRGGILTGSDGSTIEIYEIETTDDIDMYAFSAPLVDGVTYTVTNGLTRDQNVPYSQMVCFVAGTRILTSRGEIPVERLRLGDLVVTMDHGMQPIEWIGSRRVNVARLRSDANLRPIAFGAGVLANRRRLLVSAQHRMLLAPELSGHRDEVLAAAKLLADECGGGITRAVPGDEMHYVHLMLRRHEIIFAEGAPVESFYPGPQALRSCTRLGRVALAQRLPGMHGIRDMSDAARLYGPPARPILGRSALRRLLRADAFPGLSQTPRQFRPYALRPASAFAA